MPLTPKQVMRVWFDQVWNRGNHAAIAAMFPANGIAHGLGEGGADIRGPKQFLAFQQRLRGAFPTMKFTFHNVVAERNLVAARWTLTLHHLGEHLGVKPTRKKVKTSGMTLLRVSKGKIMEAWNSWDADGISQQLGVPGVTVLLPSSRRS